MNHFDDCAGIGGFSLAARWCGVETRWARENDDYARAVYAQHFPGVALFRDVREPLPDLGPVDLYTAGFPCQPVSQAGKRRGADDPRWLWPWIAETIRHLRPRWVLLENVPGLLAWDPFSAVLAALAQLGYDAEWQVLSAAAFGAPHLRRRVWIVAYTSQHGRVSRRTSNSAQIERGRKPYRGGSNADAMAFPDRQPRATRFGTGIPSVLAPPTPGRQGTLDGWPWAPEPGVGRMAHGVPSRVDRLRCLGNTIVPQVAAWIIGKIVSAEGK